MIDLPELVAEWNRLAINVREAREEKDLFLRLWLESEPDTKDNEVWWRLYNQSIIKLADAELEFESVDAILQGFKAALRETRATVRAVVLIL